MSETAAWIDACIGKGLAAFLKAKGFTKSARTWHRQAGSSWQLVNLQASQGNSGQEGRFALNLGVYHGDVESRCGPVLKAKPKAHQVTHGARLGSPDLQGDHWWSIRPDLAPASVADELVALLERQGLPWLDAHLEPAVLAKSLAAQPSLQSFSAALLAGDSQEALRRVEAAIEARPRGRAHFSQWALAAGLSLKP
ncbi:DUF4304 domain-containing protein [Gallaecimonas xiamenensis]|uniref:DUF4304 domain-containing protein n=1 Tax=Gallaecimonas xiamenensis 3-C-1 TaxID=745411 RepID=K2JLG1_9GAMM|nr:DUF4304 domain-containing protein [Gallaecimonas xiamenensis]EKE75237.1 hypothetical protein B3C1_08171 [Gallaecimonas xiamenensis 3-C-1]